MIDDITIYVDMDGVVSDFEGAIEQRFGKPIEAMAKRELWRSILRYNDTEAPWYYSLPEMPDARQLWEFVTANFSDVQMLTAKGNSPKDAGGQKRKWAGEHLGWDVPVNIVISSAEKAEYAHSKAVLIDDRSKAIDPFTAAGGIGILHKRASTTISVLRTMMEEWK
jgi:PAS domain-containing protein